MMDYQRVLTEIAAEVQPLFGQGHVADYIPALKSVPADKFGIAIETIDGRSFQTGDAREKFSIQSISKVFNLALAVSLEGNEIWQRVGMEPSGAAFNSLIQLEYEQGIPRNPFINAGALVIIDILLDHFAHPNDEMLAFVNRLRCEELCYNKQVVASERATGFRNAALVNFVKSYGNINHDVQAVLDIYFHQCSIEMTCQDLARSFLFLANGGIVPGTDRKILTTSQTKRLNAVMLTCGFYDEAGKFAYQVGMPGKSGVGGGIVAVIPGELAIAVWSPELNPQGIKALELFTTKTGKSIF